VSGRQANNDISQFSAFLSLLLSPQRPMLFLSTTLFFLFLSSALVNAGDVGVGGSCSVTNNRLQLGTYEFSTDCNSLTFCNPETNQCERKGCRRDEFPFGYAPGANLPPRCEEGQFCPDEQDRCQNKLSVDSDCQLNRDGMATLPPWSLKSFLLLHSTRRMPTSSGC